MIFCMYNYTCYFLPLMNCRKRSWGRSGQRRKTFGIKVTNLPHDITKEELYDCFNGYEIDSVVLKHGNGTPYAFVNFYTASCAQAAATNEDGTLIGENQIKCKVQTEDHKSGRQYTVKVTNLSKRTTEKTLSSLFNFGTTPRVRLIRCHKSQFNFAYVNYSLQSDSEYAVNNLDEEEVNGSQIKVKLHTGEAQERSSSPEELMHNSTDYMVQTSHPLYHSLTTSVPIAKDTCMDTCTIKVSIFGDLSSEDIDHVFRQYGNMQRKPRIRGKDPRYTYINFSSPEEASDACTLHNAKIDGVRITVKLHSSQNGGHNIDSKEIHGMSPTANCPVTMTHPSTAGSCCVKVSIYGKLTSEDIKTTFSKFGKVRRRPYLHGRYPRFTFVNFTSPQAATEVCTLNNSMVKGVKIYVKLQPSKKQGPDNECGEVQCTPLIASILHTKYKKRLEELKSEYRVTISLQPSSHSVKIVGGKEKVAAVDDIMQDLVEAVESYISEKDCNIPGHAVPLFEQDSVTDELKKIEESHSVEICVVTAPPLSMVVKLASFSNEVKQCFTPTASNTIPTCAQLDAYLYTKPHRPSASDSKTTWLWQNDSKSAYVSYTPEICTKLSKAFSSNEKTSFIKIRSQTYHINFQKMTQTNMASFCSRSIKQVASLSVQWFYKDDKKVFAPYMSDQSSEIEQMFASNNVAKILTINGNLYTFDFTTMTQRNVRSGKAWKIERRCESTEPSVPLVEHVLTLQIRGLLLSIGEATKEIESMITKATVEKKCQLYEGSSASFKTELLRKMNEYFVTAQLDGDCLKLKGMARYIEGVHLLAEHSKWKMEWEEESLNCHHTGVLSQKRCAWCLWSVIQMSGKGKSDALIRPLAEPEFSSLNVFRTSGCGSVTPLQKDECPKQMLTVSMKRTFFMEHVPLHQRRFSDHRWE